MTVERESDSTTDATPTRITKWPSISSRKRATPPLGADATRFTLVELLVLMACAALAFVLISHDMWSLGICFLLTVVAFRTSLVDFTPVGGFATLLTVLFGSASIALLVLQSIWAGN